MTGFNLYEGRKVAAQINVNYPASGSACWVEAEWVRITTNRPGSIAHYVAVDGNRSCLTLATKVVPLEEFEGELS